VSPRYMASKLATSTGTTSGRQSASQLKVAAHDAMPAVLFLTSIYTQGWI